METTDLENCKIKKLPPIDSKTNELRRAINRLENLTFSINMEGILADFHVSAARKFLPEIVKELKSGFVEATGENPWEE